MYGWWWQHVDNPARGHDCDGWLSDADRSFDAVAMGYGLRNVASIPKALQELKRVLRPGAKAAILDFNNSDNPIADSFQVIADSSLPQ